MAQPQPPTARDKLAAQALLAQGRQLFAAGQIELGCAKLDESYRLDGRTLTLFHRAQCHERAGREAQALAEYEELATKAAAANEAQLELGARRRIDALRAKGVKPAAAVGPEASGTAAATTGSPAEPTPAAPPGTEPPTPPPAATTGPPSQAPAAAAPAAVSPLESIGGARWTNGVGFVRPGEAPAAGRDTVAQPASVPAVGSVELDGFQWFATFGLCSVGLVTGGSTTHALEGAFLVEDVFRDTTSWLAPWFDLGLGLGGAPDDSAPIDFLLHGEGRFGVDLHPARLRWLGVGPFIGYGVAFYAGNDEELAHGPEFGAHTRLRTWEEPGDPPALDADLGIVARVNVEQNVAAIPRLRLSMGGDFRGLVYLDYRAESELPDELRVGAGISLF